MRDFFFLNIDFVLKIFYFWTHLLINNTLNRKSNLSQHKITSKFHLSLIFIISIFPSGCSQNLSQLVFSWFVLFLYVKSKENVRMEVELTLQIQVRVYLAQSLNAKTANLIIPNAKPVFSVTVLT